MVWSMPRRGLCRTVEILSIHGLKCRFFAIHGSEVIHGGILEMSRVVNNFDLRECELA